MTDPVRFLSVDQILRLHRRCLEAHGGQDGVRDLGLLQSAIAMPQAQFGGSYLHVDLAEMAAAYLFHVCRNHPFLDGNKRVAIAAAEIFLLLNGRQLTASDDDLEALTLKVAQGQAEKPEIAEVFRAHMRDVVE